MTWLPNRAGRPIDLVDPTPAQVDFVEEAHALANLNRYNGHGAAQVSVARHKLIGLDLCPPELRAHWLLHDVHETRLGEITRPTLEALREIACKIIAPKVADGGKLLQRVIDEFKYRHDYVIHQAAGLPMPTQEQKLAIGKIDHQCLATEHRDFHQSSSRKWYHEIMGILPARFRAKWQKPDKTAEQLVAAFRQYLPTMQAERTPELWDA